MGDVTKSFLYAWCGKNKVTPCYEVKGVGSKQRQRFLCEVTVPGFDYVGVGNSTNKKDAQTNAARDFLLYLVRVGKVSQSEVPVELPAGLQTGNQGPSDLPDGGPVAPHIQLKSSDPNYPIKDNYTPCNQGFVPNYVQRVEDQKKMEEAEDLDINSGIHGNWTLDNAKSRLHQFLQCNKLNQEYKYSVVGPDHNRKACCIINTIVDKSSADYEGQGGWSDYEESEEINISLDDWIWKEIDNVPEIKTITGMPGVNPLTMQKLGANLKSLEVFEEVLNMNFWEILSTETNRCAEQEIKKEHCPSKKIDVEWFPVTVDEMKAYFTLCIMSQI
ncbi:ATP-dependent RNA helicase A [Nephila pilipes]|uniref:ATP-dependent RNA helicase A n=1 Tax=Nephila pilipes TaxID=299642 RepID=A0A8X6P675_NEPPI|nr:ATP-dependent RNA helicase A [Nephila pilipes]